MDINDKVVCDLIPYWYEYMTTLNFRVVWGSKKEESILLDQACKILIQ